MDNRNIVWIKQEHTYEESTSADYMFPEVSLEVEGTSVKVKEEPQVRGGVDASEPNIPEHPSDTSWSTVYIKEDPERYLAADGSDNVGLVSENVYIDESDPLNIEDAEEVAPEGNEPDIARLSKPTNEADSNWLEGKCPQGSTSDNLGSTAEKSAGFITSGTTRQIFFSQDNSLHSFNDYSLKVNEFEEFNCNSCKQSFLSKYQLIMHVFIHIEGVQPPVHTCVTCGEVFFNSANLMKHSMRHPRITQDECERNRIFKEPGGAHYTEVMCVDKTPSKIDFSNNSYSESYNRNSKPSDVLGKSLTQSGHHQKLCTEHTSDRPNICDICGKTFTKSGRLQHHKLMHINERPLKCSVCGKLFTKSCGLKRHAVIHTGQRPHVCNVCGKSFKQSIHLKLHAAIHTGDLPHKCEVCGKMFIELARLKRHALIHISSRAHQCDICGKSFIHSCDLKRHTLIHTGLKPHKCDVCGKSFTDSGNLKKHRLIHSGEKPHQCDLCGKFFVDSDRLKKHALIHSGDRPHKCVVCGKSFTLYSVLKMHTLIHTGERPHKCDVCGRSFTQSGSLKKHIMTHTGEKPHICYFCGKCFTRVESLKKHSLTHIQEK